MKTGTLVVCKYRMPNDLQPWVAPIHVGRVVEPNSKEERIYCELTGNIPVQYDGFRAPDRELIEITQEQADLSPLEKVRLFIGEDAANRWIKCCGLGE